MAGFNYLLNFLNEEGFKVNEEEKHFSFKYPSEHTPNVEYEAALTFLDKASDELFERLR